MSRWGVIFLALAALLVGLAVYLRTHTSTPSIVQARRLSGVGCRQARDAFHHHSSGQWLTIHATVIRLLPDSVARYRHQRFIVRCVSGQTLLIVNDVSIGQRVPAVAGDAVTVHGQYIWDPQGGLVHFTHHDPEGGTGGWILDRNRLYALAGTVDNCADKEVDNAPARCSARA